MCFYFANVLNRLSFNYLMCLRERLEVIIRVDIRSKTSPECINRRKIEQLIHITTEFHQLVESSNKIGTKINVAESYFDALNFTCHNSF